MVEKQQAAARELLVLADITMGDIRGSSSLDRMAVVVVVVVRPPWLKSLLAAVCECCRNMAFYRYGRVIKSMSEVLVLGWISVLQKDGSFGVVGLIIIIISFSALVFFELDKLFASTHFIEL